LISDKSISHSLKRILTAIMKAAWFSFCFYILACYEGSCLMLIFILLIEKTQLKICLFPAP